MSSTAAKNSTTTKNFFGLSGEYASREESRAVILPVPYEFSASSRGVKDGPKAVLDASQQVQLFDDELWIEPYKIGVHTGAALKVQPVTNESEAPFAEVTEVVRPLVEGDKFPILLGGEQSIGLGGVKGCIDKYANLSILQIGGQCQLRSSREGNDYTGCSASYQMYKALPKPRMTQVGMRNVSWEEVAWMEEDEPNINIFWARHMGKWDYNEIIATLSENVYLSINVNVLDSSLMPATGCPEPGGIDWYQLMELIKLVCVRKNVVCADLTELSPIKGMIAPNLLAARLLYKLIGYRFALDLGVTKKYL